MDHLRHAVLEFMFGSHADLEMATWSAPFGRDARPSSQRLFELGRPSAARTYQERWIRP